MLTVDNMHTRQSNGNHALLINNNSPFDGKTPRFNGYTLEDLQYVFGKYCKEICVGSHRTFFEFDKDVAQETIDAFALEYNQMFKFKL